MYPLSSRVLRRLPLLLASVAALAPAALRAQDVVHPGAQVRILAPSASAALLHGRVVAIDSSSLLLAPVAASESLQLPVERIELLGAAAGAAAGFAITSIAARGSDCAFVCGAAEVGGAVLGGSAGLVVGGVIGSGSRAPGRWETVPVSTLRADH
ncbi:MAG TPA: hypothetical protein VGX50_18105 [Longimicrobium sp.]|jgi:hypothetical protein|nr:hypothetical protein [Longimicrobium sp.]